MFLHRILAAMAVTGLLAGCGGKPQDPRVLYQQGKEAMDKGDTARAKDLFTRAVNVEPKLADAQYRLGLIYYKENKGPEAVSHLEAAAISKPKSASIQFRLGEAYLLARNNDMAITALKTSIEIDPKAGGPYVKLAKAYRRTGNNAEAAKVIADGVAKVPKTDGFYSQLQTGSDSGGK